MVIPITLDATPPASVFHVLESYQAINMSEDMLHGFVTLCDRFGRKFLTDRVQRRGGEERRLGEDRRSNPLRRLRTGFWQAYADATDRENSIRLTRS